MESIKCSECGINGEMMDGLCWPCLLDRIEQKKNAQYLKVKEADTDESGGSSETG